MALDAPLAGPVTRRYATGTDVSVERSRGEISAILTSHGVLRMGWSMGPEGDELGFELQGGTFRFSIRKPTLEDVQAMKRADGKDLRYIQNWPAHVDAEWRRRWRANVLLLKAKLEFIDGGDTTIDRELLPYRVLRDGRTLEQAIASGGVAMLGVGEAR